MTTDRIVVIALGVIILALGVAMIRNRVRLAKINAELTRAAPGRLGEKISRESKPWVFLLMGVTSLVVGSVALLGGIFGNPTSS